MADWSELLPDLLIEIAKAINFYEDFISFASTCKSWESAAETLGSNFNGPSRFPTLMLSEEDRDKDEDEDHNNFRKLFVLSNGGMVRKVELPEARGMRCMSSHGWLFTVDKDENTTKLLHPYTRRQIELPLLDTFPDYFNDVEQHYIEKVLLSSDPSFTSNFLVIVIRAERDIGFCRPGDASWTVVERNHGMIMDFTYHDGKLYVVDPVRVMVCDIHGPEPTVLCLVSDIPTNLLMLPQLPGDLYPMVGHFYLLGSSSNADDKLLIFSREGFQPADEEYEKDDIDYNTKKFQVLEFDLSNGNWRKLESLGNKAVFLGRNSTFSIDATEDGTIKANCIYFTDDQSELYLSKPQAKGGGRDMGIYDLSDGTMEPYFNHESRSRISPPTWV